MTYAHTIQNACRAGLVLGGLDEGEPQWIGTKAQWDLFRLLESDPELL